MAAEIVREDGVLVSLDLEQDGLGCKRAQHLPQQKAAPV